MNRYKEQSLDERLDPQPHNKGIYDCATCSYYCQTLVDSFYVSFYSDKGTLTKSESATSLWRDIKFIRSLRRPHNACNKQFPFCYKNTAHFPTWNMILRKLTPDSLLASKHHIKNNRQGWENVGLKFICQWQKREGVIFNEVHHLWEKKLISLVIYITVIFH